MATGHGRLASMYQSKGTPQGDARTAQAYTLLTFRRVQHPHCCRRRAGSRSAYHKARTPSTLSHTPRRWGRTLEELPTCLPFNFFSGRAGGRKEMETTLAGLQPGRAGSTLRKWPTVHVACLPAGRTACGILTQICCTVLAGLLLLYNHMCVGTKANACA